VDNAHEQLEALRKALAERDATIAERDAVALRAQCLVEVFSLQAA